MNTSVKKDFVMPILVLTLICLVITAILAVTNNYTQPVIEKAAEVHISAGQLKYTLSHLYTADYTGVLSHIVCRAAVSFGDKVISSSVDIVNVLHEGSGYDIIDIALKKFHDIVPFIIYIPSRYTGIPPVSGRSYRPPWPGHFRDSGRAMTHIYSQLYSVCPEDNGG